MRIIEDHEVDRLGGTRTLNLDFRVIAATNRDLKDMLSWGKFRKDLYYRLNIFVLQTPDLRQIRSDIPRLAYHVLASASDRFRPHSIDPRAMQWLMAYDWPGNVRELRNVLEVASAVAGDGPILEKHLPMEIRSGDSTTQTFDGVPYSLKEEIALTESRALRRALNVSGGNRSEAARLLGIHRTSLYKRMKQYGLDVGDET